MSVSLTLQAWSCGGQVLALSQGKKQGYVKINVHTKNKKRVRYIQRWVRRVPEAQTIVLFFSLKSVCVGSW